MIGTKTDQLNKLRNFLAYMCTYHCTKIEVYKKLRVQKFNCTKRNIWAIWMIDDCMKSYEVSYSQGEKLSCWFMVCGLYDMYWL